jgi:hypothetical protein
MPDLPARFDVLPGDRAGRAPSADRARGIAALVWVMFSIIVWLGLLSLGGERAGNAWIRGCALAPLFQLFWVLRRFYRTGWIEGFAYFFHWLFIGGACVAFLLTDAFDTVTPIQRHLLVAGINAQVLLGALVLGSKPAQIGVQFSPRAVSALMLVCGTAALVKFGFYIQQIGEVGDHLAIYTEGEAVRDATPLPLRVLATGASLVAVVALCQNSVPMHIKLLALLAICMEFAIGTRSRPIFLLCAVLALGQAALIGSRRSRRLVALVPVLGIVGAGAVGYFREGYDVGVGVFVVISLASLGGTVEAALASTEIVSMADTVIAQLPVLIAPTDRTQIDTAAKLVSTETNPWTYDLGYGLSSSTLLETSALLSPQACLLAYPLLCILLVLAVRRAIDSRNSVWHLAGIAVLPTLFYLWRAELWQPLIALAKALPFLLLLAAARPNRDGRRKSGA